MKFVLTVLACLFVWLLIVGWLKFYAQSALMLHDEHGSIKLQLTELHAEAKQERKQINDKLDILLNFVTNCVNRDITATVE